MENLYNCRLNYRKKIENIVANREIAHLEQFLLLSRCFQKLSAENASIGGKGLTSYLTQLIEIQLS